MKLAKRYSRTTAWSDYQSCREKLEANGTPLAWWAVLIVTSLAPLLVLTALWLEHRGPRLDR